MALFARAALLPCLATSCAGSFGTCETSDVKSHLSLLQTSVRTQRHVASLVASRAASSSSQGLSSLDEDWDEPPKTHGAAFMSFEEKFIQSESDKAAEAAARQAGKEREMREQKERREVKDPHLDPLVEEIAGYDWDAFEGEAKSIPKVGPAWESEWEKNYRLKAEGHDPVPRDQREQHEAALEARNERRAKRRESRRAAIDDRLASAVRADAVERDAFEHAKSAGNLSVHERDVSDHKSTHENFVHNMTRAISNTSRGDETASRSPPSKKEAEAQKDPSYVAGASHEIEQPKLNASHGAELAKKHSAHIVLGYVLQRGQRCGVCGDANNIRLGKQGESFDAATRATAVKVCGQICDKHVECGGFNFVESLGNCYYRKVTSCQEVDDEDRDCYAKANATAGIVQKNAAGVVAGQLHGLAQGLKDASAALGGVNAVPAQGAKAVPAQGAIQANAMPSLGFVKTPRTGGSTVTSILMRLGEAKNLSFFLPSGSAGRAKSRMEDESFGWPGPFPGPDAAALNGAPLHQFDMLCHGGVFGVREMRAYLKRPKPFFFTVLRRPALQMASSFNFFKHPAGDSWEERIAWLEKLWLSDEDASLGEKAAVLRGRFQNPQAHDLGWYQRVGGTPVFDQDDAAIAAWVEELEETLGLVMLTEHLDEGLALLGKELGLSIEELAHAGRHQREASEAPELSLKDASAIEELVHVDSAIYASFNRTFWESWEKAGGYDSFAADLAALKQRSAELDRACADEDETLCPWSFKADVSVLTDHIKRRQLATDA